MCHDVKQSDWAKNDLDHFVLARFEQDAFAPPATADPRTLARRLYYDLTGLPPTPEQVADFDEVYRNRMEPTPRSMRSSTNCSTARASASTSRGYGSTWSATATATASIGTSFARRPGDIATTSSARSTPTNRFDQFIREQLAGDELFDGPPKTAAEQDCLIATGYLATRPARQRGQPVQRARPQPRRAAGRRDGNDRRRISRPDADLLPLPRP